MTDGATPRPAGCDDDLVIGIGNPLRGDDGIGWRLARAARGRCVHQLTPELAPDLRALRRVLFIDAWLAPEGAAPLLRPLRPRPQGELTSHRLGPAQLLALTELLYGAPPEAAELLVPAFAFEPGSRLSGGLRAGLPAALALLRAWCAGPAWGEPACMS